MKYFELLAILFLVFCFYFTQCHTIIEENECLSHTCLNGGTCNEMSGRFSCVCAAGYTGDQCQTEVNECASNPCLNGGVCNDLVAGFSCNCAQRFEGVYCEQEINECVSNPCENNGTCRDRIANYWCECPVGFEGDRCQTRSSVARNKSDLLANAVLLEVKSAT